MLALSVSILNFYINHVLYSPHFLLNLIYVAKLCESLTCFFHFSPDKCLIHDQQSLQMIGLAKQMDGLYKFYPSSSSCNLELSSSFNKSCNVVHYLLVTNPILLYLQMHCGTLG